MRRVKVEAKEKDQGYNLLQTCGRPLYGVPIWPGITSRYTLARPGPAEGVGGLWDRQGQRWGVFDLDGTRQAARQRALPQGPDLPPPQRRLLAACAPASTGRKQARRSGPYRHDSLL